MKKLYSLSLILLVLISYKILFYRNKIDLKQDLIIITVDHDILYFDCRDRRIEKLISLDNISRSSRFCFNCDIISSSLIIPTYIPISHAETNKIFYEISFINNGKPTVTKLDNISETSPLYVKTFLNSVEKWNNYNKFELKEHYPEDQFHRIYKNCYPDNTFIVSAGLNIYYYNGNNISVIHTISSNKFADELRDIIKLGHVDISSDKTKILYTIRIPNRKPVKHLIYEVDLDSGKEIFISKGYSPQYSIDGKYIIYVNDGKIKTYNVVNRKKRTLFKGQQVFLLK